jgi:hypothetical protein
MKEVKDVNVNIDIDNENKIIVLTFFAEDKQIRVGFNIQEAQLLQLMMGEAVTALLLDKMQIGLPVTLETKH